MALYHQYRPKRFDGVIGQEHVTRTLRNAIKMGLISHAYLFFGPRGTGKTSMARIFAAAVNCLGKDPPCGECSSCKTFRRGSLDLIEIDAASNTGVEIVRKVIGETAAFRPNEATYKIYVIDESHMLSRNAFNALLKVLEEPPPHVIFILVTTEFYKLPDTVRSRCQQHSFHRVSSNEIVKLLAHISEQEGFEVEPGSLQMIVQQADGCVRDAVMLLDQAAPTINCNGLRVLLGVCGEGAIAKFVSHVEKNDLGATVGDVSQLVEDGTDLGQFVSQTTKFLHKALRFRLGVLKDVSDVTKTYLEAITLSTKAIIELVHTLVDAREHFRYNSDMEIVLMLHLAELLDGREPQEVPLQKVDPLSDPIVRRLIQLGAEVVFHRLV